MAFCEDNDFAKYNGFASRPTPRSATARLSRSTLDGGAIEDVFKMASNIRMFPRIAGIAADKILTIVKQMSRKVISDCTTLNAQSKSWPAFKGGSKSLRSRRKHSPYLNWWLVCDVESTEITVD